MKHADRNAQTRQEIKDAFIRLIDAKGFNNLTVSDITREAGVSRGTFYVHYTDKYDLLEKIETTLHDNIQKAIIENFDLSTETVETTIDINGAPFQVFTRALHYVNSERHTIKALLSDAGHPQFFDVIQDAVDEAFMASLAKNHGHLSNVLPADYAKEIVLNSALNLIRYWVNKDDPEPVDELIDILMKSRLLPPNELVTFN
jgi:AcrR family transcriptional regulator